MKNRTFRPALLFWLLALSALSSSLMGCATPPVGSPQWYELMHQYEVGCRPEDAEGYEKLFEYCHRH